MIASQRRLDKKELLKWLRGRLRDTERARDAKANDHEYGDALLCEGIAQAYAFTILHITRDER
jgi:hypothetical protein